MRRREFLGALGCGVTWPFLAFAQQQSVLKTDAIYFDDALPRFGYRLRKGADNKTLRLARIIDASTLEEREKWLTERRSWTSPGKSLSPLS